MPRVPVVARLDDCRRTLVALVAWCEKHPESVQAWEMRRQVYDLEHRLAKLANQLQPTERQRPYERPTTQ